MLNHHLHFKLFLGLFFGALLGVLLQSGLLPLLHRPLLTVIEIGSIIFLSLLKMVVIPLVVSSLYMGIASLPFEKIKTLGWKVLLYFSCTSLLAIITGLVIVNLAKPGVGVNLSLGEPHPEVTTPDSVWHMVAGVIPSNPVEALATTDMLGVIFFTLLFALFSIKVGGESLSFLNRLFKAVYTIMNSMVLAILALAPYGIFCLMGRLVATTGWDVMVPLMHYLLCVTLALLFHIGVTLPVLIKIFTNRSPLEYLRAMSPALLTAFSSASSAATLPLTMECATLRGKVKQETASLVLPIGATVNMDGTALYECVAVIFIAQAVGVELTLVKQLMIILTALLVSIGAAGIPHAGLVMMVVILEAVGLPVEATALIWGVDRVVDMARTAVNVYSDSTGALILDQ